MTTTATHLTWSEEIGKRVRTGDWADQAVSTVTRILEAIPEREYERIGRFKPALPVIQPGRGGRP